MATMIKWLWCLWLFFKWVGRPYDDLADSFYIGPGLAWTLAKILSGVNGNGNHETP